MNLNQIRNNLLEKSKPLVLKKGWHDNLLKELTENSKFSYAEIQSLFPNGCKDLVQIYLNEINKKMNEESKKLNLIRLRVHERIRELLILRFKILLQEKKIISKTFTYLLLPQNFQISSKNLYKTVDQIWFLAGDNSTDFNFYSKRVILSTIYSSTLIHFINNDNLQKTIDLLDKQLKKVSKIPNLKNNFKNVTKLIPNILKFGKNFSFFKQ